MVMSDQVANSRGEEARALAEGLDPVAPPPAWPRRDSFVRGVVSAPTMWALGAALLPLTWGWLG